jgi:hypothetical protein
MPNCKICKKKFYGRSDKIFCDVKCKSDYHRALRKKSKLFCESINKILARNHAILMEVLGKNSHYKKVNAKILDQKKFNFKYHTHFHLNKENKMYHYLYNIAWMRFSNDEILIIRQNRNS